MVLCLKCGATLASMTAPCIRCRAYANLSNFELVAILVAAGVPIRAARDHVYARKAAS
jgi:hypothetical protein